MKRKRMERIIKRTQNQNRNNIRREQDCEIEECMKYDKKVNKMEEHDANWNFTFLIHKRTGNQE